MGHSLHIFAWGMPLHAHVFSFTHNAVVRSNFVFLILDLVTYCCVCLVFMNGMGGGGMVGMGFVFYLLGMVWRHFSV